MPKYCFIFNVILKPIFARGMLIQCYNVCFVIAKFIAVFWSIIKFDNSFWHRNSALPHQSTEGHNKNWIEWTELVYMKLCGRLNSANWNWNKIWFLLRPKDELNVWAVIKSTQFKFILCCKCTCSYEMFELRRNQMWDHKFFFFLWSNT